MISFRSSGGALVISTATGLTAGSEALLPEARDLLETVLPPHLCRFHELLPVGETSLRCTTAHRLPVLTWLGQLPQPAPRSIRSLVLAFTKMAPQLQWGQTYTAADVSANFLERYGWHEVVGTRGPIASKDIALGFLLLGRRSNIPGTLTTQMRCMSLWRVRPGGGAMKGHLQPSRPARSSTIRQVCRTRCARQWRRCWRFMFGAVLT